MIFICINMREICHDRVSNKNIFRPKCYQFDSICTGLCQYHQSNLSYIGLFINLDILRLYRFNIYRMCCFDHHRLDRYQFVSILLVVEFHYFFHMNIHRNYLMSISFLMFKSSSRHIDNVLDQIIIRISQGMILGKILYLQYITFPMMLF